MRRLIAAAGLAALAACTAPGPAEPGMERFTAAPGEVMALTDRCITEVCGVGNAGGLKGVQAMVYLGMRSPTEAVFERVGGMDFDGPVRPSGVKGIVVPVRPERLPDPAAPFIPPRAPDEKPRPGVAEVTVDPALGAEFGVEDIDVIVESITPARAVYTISRF